MRSFAILLAAVLAAGCAGQGHPEEAGSSVPPAAAGAVSGVVLDDVGLPIEGVSVAVVGSENHTATSAQDGRFLLAGLAPGTHQIAAAKLGYKSAVRSFLVPAGDPLEIQITLVPEKMASIGRTEILPGRAFISCSIATGALTPTVTQACGFDENNQPLFPFLVSVADGLIAVVLEMYWEPTSAQTAQELRLGLWKNGNCPDARCSAEHFYPEEPQGPSPVRLAKGNETEPFRSELHYVEPTRLTAVALVADATITEVQVAWQQPVDFQVSIFYNLAPPDGYTALPV